MNLGVLGSNLVLDVEAASKRRGARAILWVASGGVNQSIFHDDMGRLVPQHCKGLALDAKGETAEPGAHLIFWTSKVPAALNQQFVLDDDGFLVVGLGNGSFVAGASEVGRGARLSLVPRSSPQALCWEWRDAPDAAGESDAPPPPRAGKSATDRGACGASSASSRGGDAASSSSAKGSSGRDECGPRGYTVDKGSCPASGGGGGAEAPGEVPAALQAAIRAENYYEALGIDEKDQFSLEDGSVRRAYLKTSVKVHPDKHPAFPSEATVAFQRVSEAYGGLKDEPGGPTCVFGGI